MMLQDPQWRLLLIELAEKHKSCSLLHYAVQSISRAGHHKEIASVTSASTYFSVFHGVFLDTLSRLHLSSNEELDRDMKNLKNICRQSAYTYLYISELCRRVEGHGEMEKVVVEKVRCIRQVRDDIVISIFVFWRESKKNLITRLFDVWCSISNRVVTKIPENVFFFRFEMLQLLIVANKSSRIRRRSYMWWSGCSRLLFLTLRVFSIVFLKLQKEKLYSLSTWGNYIIIMMLKQQ